MEVGALPSGLGIFLACVLSWIRVYYGLLHLPGRPLVSIRNIRISRASPLLYLFKVKLTLIDSPCISTWLILVCLCRIHHPIKISEVNNF